jgi:hypothetical protein
MSAPDVMEIARNMVQSPDNWPPMLVKRIAEIAVAALERSAARSEPEGLVATDIMERLRVRAITWVDEAQDCADAIVEIERLRAAARGVLTALKAIKALTDTGEPDWNDAIGDHAGAAIAQAEAALAAPEQETVSDERDRAVAEQSAARSEPH